MRKIYTVCISLLVLSTCLEAQVNHVVISQVYGGGGNSGATYTNDFIELFNPTNATVSLSGWSVQYASSAGTSWQVTSLSGSIAPGRYYLVQEAAGAGGTTALPMPDAAGSIAMSASSGKVALVNSTTALTGTGCPFGVTIIDFAGFGGANCFEGAGATPTLTNTTAALRANNGCTDTDNNASDFSSGSPNPRNSASPQNTCGVSSPTASVAAGSDLSEPATNGGFTVNLSVPAPAGGITVAYLLSGSATISSDYTDPQGGSITIPESSSSGTITLNVVDDNVVEATKNIMITLTGVSSPFVLGTSSATINVLDDDVPPPANVVINQVYGGGGNSGAVYKNDFIELYNNENSPVSLAGWSVQYASASGSSWQVTALSGTIPAHGFYLVQEAAGSGGTINLPAPDATGGINMSSTSGKVLLCNTTAAQSGSDPTGANIADKVGFGSANGFETAPTAALNNTTSAQRITDGVDNDNNSTDFKLADPNPRNSTYTTAPPVIVSVSPPDNSTGIPYNFTPVIVFNKPVQKGSGFITFFENGTPISIDVISSDVVVSNLSVTINISLSSGKSYYVHIDAGAFADVYNNAFAGISNNTEWDFSTYDYSTPVTLPVCFDFQDCVGNGLLPNGFTQQSLTGDIVWDCTPFGRDPAAPAGTAAFPNAVQMNGFANGTNVPNVDWLISPAIDLTGTDYPLLSFWTRTAFNGQSLQLKVSTDYIIGDPSSATWTDVNGKFPDPTSNTWTLSENINLSAFKASNVHFAFVYTSTSEDGARWTIDDICLVNSPTPPPPSLTTGANDIQFNYVAAGLTGDKTFTFIGNDLVDDVTLTSTGDFLLSKDGNSFSTSISYSAIEANNITKTVTVRFSPIVNNQNYTGMATVSTSALSEVVNLKGTSINPETTLEVVNWNLEWFGSTETGLGPIDVDRQEQNVKTIMQNIGADIFGLVEVVDIARLDNIVSQMPGYSYVVCDYGSHTNPFEADAGSILDAQKEAIVYKTSLFSNVSTTALATDGVNTAADLSNPAYNYFSSGRYPFMMTADVTLNCSTKKIRFVVLHAKANTSPTVTSYARRKAGADTLKTILNTMYPDDNIVILGDINDDLDSTITAGINPRITSYYAFTNDTVSTFSSPTLALSLAGKRSTVTYNDVIDHVILSNEMQQYYMPGSANILTDAASLVSNYGSTTSDHYPVFTRYQFETPAAPVITSCPAVNPFCVSNDGNYMIPALTASGCGELTYSYVITRNGTTERTGNSGDASGSFGVGTSVIDWTVTDLNNNSVTCQTTVVVNANPVATIPDAYALSSGVLPNTVYIGYSPASSITLSVNVNGVAPYQYQWSTGSTASSVTVSPTIPATYSVQVTDVNGCQTSANKSIAVMDIRGGHNLNKVIICHKNKNTQELSPSAVQAHLNHGDMLGSCEPPGEPEPGLHITVLPNPTFNYFNVLISSNSAARINLKVFTLTGRIVETRSNLSPGFVRLGHNYHRGIYILVVEQGKERKTVKLIKL